MHPRSSGGTGATPPAPADSVAATASAAATDAETAAPANRGAAAPAPACPEVWGGVECTVNRVGNEYVDQLILSGHDRRVHDLDRFASLGVTSMRYPVLWERVAPHGLAHAGWAWSDARLEGLVSLGISPVVGLLHHGSGPRDTGLLDPVFPRKFAAYARAFIERYPWVTRVTPVNEPLTTARFSGLYGHWYPHDRSDASFVRMLLNQCHATRAAMREMRAVNPGTQLVQTEDLGKTHATPLLQYQARFENARRWLTFDVLCGRVTPSHPLYGYLVASGATERELWAFVEDACPPDVIGLNHYVTSERYLDEDVGRYPPHTRGGNGRHAYADTEVVRSCAARRAGPKRLLREAWDRYGIPVAVTEVHLGCEDVQEQQRWLGEVWGAARALRADGCDVRAVTSWALLGTFGWDKLVTVSSGTYEPGAFDVRSGVPEETPVGEMVRSLATRGEYDHTTVRQPGWWHPERAQDGALTI